MALSLSMVLSAGDSVRPGLEGLDWAGAEEFTPEEAALVKALGQPLTDGLGCEAALQAWFDGRLAASQKDMATAAKHWTEGLTKLEGLKPLPTADWGKVPDATFEMVTQVRMQGLTKAELWIVLWKVDDLKQYGVLLIPKNRGPEQKFPLLLYMHGAAYGVPVHALPWLADIAGEGYVIIGPALRGEDLFAGYGIPRELAFKCDGEIENLDGEVDDALAAVSAAKKLPYVAPGKFGVVGHSFGAGAGLLAAARHPDTACVVSYDAWLVNPFRFYWDRVRRGANNWLSWADFCNQPVADQLSGLMTRSIVHNAEKLHCPLLLFIGGAYEGSVFHQSHEDFIAQLKKYDKPYIYDVVPGGGHNFVLYYEDEPARYAYAKHMEFLAKHLPPVKPAPAAQPAPVQE
jgi:dienelactone hydrolase